MAGLSVRGSDHLRAAVSAVAAARRDIKNDIARATRSTMSPVWQAEVRKRVRDREDERVIASGARILAGNPPVAVAAQSRRKLRGGLVPNQDWQGFEFGANRARTTRYTRRAPGGKSHQVTRHTARQLPTVRRKGRIAYPALQELAPRLASLWVSIVVRKFNEAWERGEA